MMLLTVVVENGEWRRIESGRGCQAAHDPKEIQEQQHTQQSQPDRKDDLQAARIGARIRTYESIWKFLSGCNCSERVVITAVFSQLFLVLKSVLFFFF